VKIIYALDIGSRLELFVDDWIIDAMHNLRLVLHRPIPREVAIEFDEPWEGPASGYVTVFKDEDRYRMYYRGAKDKKGYAIEQHTCYAESKDGVTWIKPSLGICKYKGSTDNNIIWTEAEAEWERCTITHNFIPFKDGNPEVPKEERYKAIAGGPPIALASPDGLHWKKIREEPIIYPYKRCKREGDYISIAFWDGVQHQYVAYLRGWRSSRSTVTQCEENLEKPTRVFRQVLRCTSPDFINWTEPKFIDLGDTPLEHFYTSNITPYFRAPHIYLAFPNRFVPERKKVKEHPEMGVNDAVFMSSRDGIHFDRRFMEAFIRPGLDQKNWTDRNIYPAWGVVPTDPEEISIYYTENYRHPTCRLRRAALRTDGFVSIHADYHGGKFVTRPLTFCGRELVINYSTSAVGSIKIEIQNIKGKPISGYTFKDAEEIYGDEIEHVVEWKDGRDLSHLAGQPIRLKFSLKDADLYSIQFRNKARRL